MNYFQVVIDLDSVGDTVQNMFHVKQIYNIVDIIKSISRPISTALLYFYSYFIFSIHISNDEFFADY